MAAGIKPIAAINAVIITGLTLESTPEYIASFKGIFSSKFFLKTLISITPF